MIDVNCKSSSTGQIVYNLFTYLNQHGDNAAVCYGRGERIDEQGIYKFSLDWETRLHALLTRLTGYTGCFSFFSTRRLIRYIESFQPDTVHIHELHAYFVNIKQLLDYLAKKKIRVVHTLHCEFSYTGKCGHSVECEKWKTECGHCPHLRDYPSTWFFDHTKHMLRVKKNALLGLDHPVFTAPSSWLLNRMKESFLKDSHLALVYNSIDTAVFCPQNADTLREKHRLRKDQKVALALAPDLMSENKGGKYVLQLAERMKDVRFILIGANEPAYEKDNVVSLGKIYDKELLAQYYSLADVFVICSKNENFPTTCVEAVCCGTPVFGFDAGGTKETAPEPVGCFVRQGDIERLKNEITRYLCGERRIDEKAFASIREHYSIQRMAEEYRKLYENRGRKQ